MNLLVAEEESEEGMFINIYYIFKYILIIYNRVNVPEHPPSTPTPRPNDEIVVGFTTEPESSFLLGSEPSQPLDPSITSSPPNLSSTLSPFSQRVKEQEIRKLELENEAREEANKKAKAERKAAETKAKIAELKLKKLERELGEGAGSSEGSLS